MGLIESRALVQSLSPPLDHLLATQLVDEFVSMERRFIQRDWEPAELDGGQFSEVLARVLYHLDSGNLNPARDFGKCLEYVESDAVAHTIQPRHDAIHIAKVLRTIYKFRSQRGAVHVSPNYKANHMDSKFLIESVRWCMAETLRMFWHADRDKVASAIRELLQFDVPCIGAFEDVLLVQRTDLGVDEEILVLLHYAGEAGFTRRQLGTYCMFPSQRVSDALKRLASPEFRQIVLMGNDRYRLTDLGSRRLRESLADKLLLQ